MSRLKAIKKYYAGTEKECFSLFEIKTVDYEWLVEVAELAEALVNHSGPKIPTMPLEAGSAWIRLRNKVNEKAAPKTTPIL